MVIIMVGMVTMVSQPVTRLVPPHRYIAFPALLSGGAARPKIDCDLLKSSVGDPWHFGADLDPGSRIRTSGYWIRIQLRVRLLSSMTLRM